METILNETHPCSQMLEDYVFGRLTVSQAASVSAHLLECDACSEYYEQEVKLLEGLRQVRHKEPTAAARSFPLPFWLRPLRLPGTLLAAAAATVLAILLVPRWNTDSSPVLAELTAYRDATTVVLPAGRNLMLRPDIAGLPADVPLRAEVVDSSGRAVWSGVPAGRPTAPEIRMERRLPPGQYWVRLYAAPGAELLREFSLQLK